MRNIKEEDLIRFFILNVFDTYKSEIVYYRLNYDNIIFFVACRLWHEHKLDVSGEKIAEILTENKKIALTEI